MGQMMVFWSRQRPCRACPGLYDGNGYKKDRERRQMAYIGSQTKGKTEIPVASGFDLVTNRNLDPANHSPGIGSQRKIL
jgi:hypothetical protein